MDNKLCPKLLRFLFLMASAVLSLWVLISLWTAVVPTTTSDDPIAPWSLDEPEMVDDKEKDTEVIVEQDDTDNLF